MLSSEFLFQEMLMVYNFFKVELYRNYLLGVLTCSVLVFECTNIIIIIFYH